ncbi:MAG: DNA translocase FtsK, partial [Candidatus Levybacteria bacterium]|nr:DNA translocase FtsK [Candidatus Levybacteria bacterium]
MPRRKHYRKSKFKFKLKKGTVYSIFGLGFIVVGAILFLSFTKNGSSFLFINNLLERYFGGVAFLFPLVLIFIGFSFFKLKLFLSKINISVGFALFFLSINALTRGGLVGGELFGIL